jgi:hypothetical protein
MCRLCRRPSNQREPQPKSLVAGTRRVPSARHGRHAAGERQCSVPDAPDAAHLVRPERPQQISPGHRPGFPRFRRDASPETPGASPIPVTLALQCEVGHSPVSESQKTDIEFFARFFAAWRLCVSAPRFQLCARSRGYQARASGPRPDLLPRRC